MKIKDLPYKLSSCNLFNYLFPGLLFVILPEKTTYLIPCSIQFDVINVVIIYFKGFAISRIRSLIIEDVLKRRITIKFRLISRSFEPDSTIEQIVIDPRLEFRKQLKRIIY